MHVDVENAKAKNNVNNVGLMRNIIFDFACVKGEMSFTN